MIEKLSLNALKYFYMIAQTGSVTNAAEKLCVTQSAVSKQLKNLEEMMNVQLFDRVQKKLYLTQSGKQLYQTCQTIFVQLDDCLVDITKKQNTPKPLVLSCESTIAMKWLIPRLATFKSDFNVVLLTAGGSVDFESGQIDLALRRNDFKWKDTLFSEKIIDEYMLVVKAKNNTENKILRSTSRPNFKYTQGKNDEILEFEHFYLCLEGCLAGLGKTMLSGYMIEKELKYEMLDIVEPIFKDGSAYYLLSNTHFEQDDRKIIFLKWLKQEMKNSEKGLQQAFNL
ncbi:LysR family transcriptional regulator [Acinetobacter sp. HY1485]|uniref:LysR family transcriptional regulator n=1 Tax=Acinetobacter sp. HY1485 TaxID=2970918 RepID=UPI0022B9AE1B|nr:LysR family transcriptional regulator [Acinetobacter sp. HY1485]